LRNGRFQRPAEAVDVEERPFAVVTEDFEDIASLGLVDIHERACAYDMCLVGLAEREARA
jgi:hypothetical protein